MLSKTPVMAQLILAAAAVIVIGTTSTASAQCGNSIINSGGANDEVCDNGGVNNTQAVGCCAAGCLSFVTAGTVCRPDAGICDNGAETCTGSTAGCPADGFASGSTVCRAPTGLCDAAENCTGTSGGCPDDAAASPGTVCRTAVGGCDQEETCSGTSCPTDLKKPNGTTCRFDSSPCDAGPETCDGSSNDCPADTPSPEDTLCRPAGGECDQAEVCNGSSSTCPADTKKSSLCRPAAGDCDLPETCNGTSNFCPANAHSTDICRPAVNENCDVAESCDGTNDNCPDDVLVNCADDDDLDCTVATCDEFEGCLITNNCVEICRGPGFWATHSGWEKGENIGQEVLDDVGTLHVCGEIIANTTDLGYLTASLEGFCMRTQGVKQRQLYRTLLTTAFNCAISEGKDCESITDPFVDVSWNECNALCDGQDVGEDGPTLKECKDQFGCFNGGGQIIDGECAKGTCASDPSQYCGGDFDDCGEEDECVRFADNCASQPLCSDDSEAAAEICPKPGPASSPKTCREARHNDCTIDNCPADPDFSCAGHCGDQAPGGCYCDTDSCSLGDGCPDRDAQCEGICF